MRLIKAGVSTHRTGCLPSSGTSGQGRVSICWCIQTQIQAIGLEVAGDWGQRHADRLLKGQVCANLLALWVYLVRLELWRDPYNGSGPGGAQGEDDNRIHELRDGDTASPHALDKADITNRLYHLFPAKLRILTTQFSRQH